MRERRAALAEAYAVALRDYLDGAGEAALLRAYEAGRGMLTRGLGVLELAALHQQALTDALTELPAGEHALVARSAAEFFTEALGPFEMSQRGLRGQIQEQKRLERLKDEFISVVSHELRTPLTSIHGALNLLVEGKAGDLPPEAQRFLEIAYRNSARVVRLVNEILDLQKIESGVMELDVRPVEVGHLLAEAVEANLTYAARFEVAIALEEPSAPLFVEADPDRLLQVLANLLCNAARFSPPGETVTVRAERLPGFVRVCVSDRGSGIPEAFRPRIFGKFAQADSATPSWREGSGLGLSISKAIVERLGGRIGFESQVGRGSIFHFELPEWSARAPEAARG